MWYKTILGSTRWKSLIIIISYMVGYYFTAIYDICDLSCLVYTYTSMTSCNEFIYLIMKTIKKNNYKS